MKATIPCEFFQIRFYPADEEVYAWLREQLNMQGYLKELIRADMERQKKEA